MPASTRCTYQKGTPSTLHLSSSSAAAEADHGHVPVPRGAGTLPRVTRLLDLHCSKLKPAGHSQGAADSTPRFMLERKPRETGQVCQGSDSICEPANLASVKHSGTRRKTEEDDVWGNHELNMTSKTVSGRREKVLQEVGLVTPAPAPRGASCISSPQILGVSNWSKEENRRFDSVDQQCGPRLRSMSKLVLSCPKPPPQPIDYADTEACHQLGGQTDMNIRVRKRPLRDELETVVEEGEHGTLPPAGSRIMVYVRMRPMSKSEKEAGARPCVRVVNKQDVYLTEFASETDYLRLKRLKGRHFVFDAAFPDVTGQQDVYNTSTAELVEGVLQGRNASVFCYGATGAGKTHTMLGSTQNPGVMVLALKDLFAKLRQQSREGGYVVRLSYLEVYNESVRDLLSPGRPLVLREDSKQGTIAAGLTQYQAYSAEEVMALLHQGNQNRTTEPTRVNETSSRSHAILQVCVEYKVQYDSHFVCRTGKLSLIDLAGSERALATDQRTIRSLEGANINRSLLALSSCINALVEGKRHIPFRNSKLTQLLKDSLGGACQTAMIANVSPSNLSFGETQNTLHWADRAKQIRTKACDTSEEIHVPGSESDQAKLLLEVQKENQQLRMQLARLQQKLLSVESSAIMVTRQSPAPPPSQMSRTPVSESKAARHDECRAVEDALRKKVQALEREREITRREMVERETKVAASITTIQRDHSLQIRQKDDFIRTLCSLTQKSIEPEAEKKIAPPLTTRARIKSSTTAHQREPIRSTRSTTGGARRVTMGEDFVPSSLPPTKQTTHQAAGTKRPAVPGTPYSNLRTRRSRHALDESEENIASPKAARPYPTAGGAARRLSKIPGPPPFSSSAVPPKTPISSSKAAMKKRTFWDITNANSPSAPVGRCTRSNTTATPSMLLQPGFLGGRRPLLQ